MREAYWDVVPAPLYDPLRKFTTDVRFWLPGDSSPTGAEINPGTREQAKNQGAPDL